MFGGYTGETGRVYVTGVQRNRIDHDNVVTHLYDGTFKEPGKPLCKRGWNREPWDSGYSIFRNNISSRGICKWCKRKADRGEDGVDYKD